MTRNQKRTQTICESIPTILLLGNLILTVFIVAAPRAHDIRHSAEFWSLHAIQILATVNVFAYVANDTPSRRKRILLGGAHIVLASSAIVSTLSFSDQSLRAN